MVFEAYSHLSADQRRFLQQAVIYSRGPRYFFGHDDKVFAKKRCSAAIMIFRPTSQNKSPCFFIQQELTPLTLTYAVTSRQPGLQNKPRRTLIFLSLAPTEKPEVGEFAKTVHPEL